MGLYHIGQRNSFNRYFVLAATDLHWNIFFKNGGFLFFCFVQNVAQFKSKPLFSHLQNIVRRLARRLLQETGCAAAKMNNIHRFVHHHTGRGVFAEHNVISRF